MSDWNRSGKNGSKNQKAMEQNLKKKFKVKTSKTYFEHFCWVMFFLLFSKWKNGKFLFFSIYGILWIILIIVFICFMPIRMDQFGTSYLLKICVACSCSSVELEDGKKKKKIETNISIKLIRTEQNRTEQDKIQTLKIY